MLTCYSNDVRDLFEPTIQEVLNLVAKQKEMIENEGKSLDVRRTLLRGMLANPNSVWP